MAYKIFISAADDAASRAPVNAIKEALFRFNEFPVTAVTLEDVAAPDPVQRWEAAKRFIEECDVFVGVYDRYGTVPPGETHSYAELEYRYAAERGLTCLIFIPDTLRTGGEERFMAFRNYLAEMHVLHFYTTLADLQAKVILAISTYKKTRRHTQLRPAIQTILPPQPAPEIDDILVMPEAATTEEIARLITRETAAPPPAPGAPGSGPAAPAPPPTTTSSPLSAAGIQTLVDQVMEVAADDIEQIVRRALELHEAQRAVQDQRTPDGWLSVNPIFGAPMQQSQFQADIFMIMPFRDHLTAVYQNVIRPVVSNLNLTIKRGDDFASTTGVIINEVWAAINACRVVIVETSEINANVYYELGIAHTLGKPAILLTQEKDPLKWPFDIRHLRFIVYENTIEGGEKLEADLRKAIVWILNDLEAMQAAPQSGQKG